MAMVAFEPAMTPHTGVRNDLLKFLPNPSAKIVPTKTHYLHVEVHLHPPSPRPASALRLPSELLQEVFLIYSHSCPRRRKCGDTLEWNSWMAVTHVCRRWRSVALAFPALWTRVTVLNARIARAMFHRSAQLPLDVVCHVTLHDQPGAARDTVARAHERLAVTMEELHRIHRLEIVSTPWSRTFVSGMTWLGRPAPQLRSLALDICPLSPAKRSEQIVPTLTLLQASNLTRLHSLHLNDSLHRWTVPLPSNLRVLEVTHAQLLVQEGGVWTFNTKLLSALSAVSNLEQLVLSDAQPAEPSCHPVMPTASPVVSLPHLRSLTLEALPLPGLWLFNQLRLPPSTTLHLDFLADDDLDVQAVTPLLAKPLCGRTDLHPLETYPIRSFLLRLDSDAVTMAAWTEALPPTSDLTHPPPKVTARFALSPSSSSTDADTDARRLQWSVLAEDVLEDLRFPHLETLHLGPLRPYTLATDLRRALTGCAPLHTLAVHGWTTRALLALVYPTHPFRPAPFLPALRTLVLRAVHFPRALPRRRRADTMHLALLRERLAQRAARGCAVRVLVLRGCYNVTEDDVEALRGVVGAVEWDGTSRGVVGAVEWDGTSRVGGADVWTQEEVPYGMQYPWEVSDSDSEDA